MVVLDLIERAKAARLHLQIDGDALKVSGARSAAGLALEIGKHKAEVMALLRSQGGRCDESRHDPTYWAGRAQAERQDQGSGGWDAETIQLMNWLEQAKFPDGFELHPHVRVLDSRRFKQALLADLAAGPGGVVAENAKEQLHHVFKWFQGRDKRNG